MDIGAILIGVAAAILVGSYAAQPLRRSASAGSSADVDALIERWVHEARQAQAPALSADDAEATNFCHQCGRRVQADHRFCPHCGAPLREA